MKHAKLSRGPEVDVQACVKQAGSRYNLVLVAAVRAREIKRQHRENPNASYSQVHTNVTALQEIESGAIDPAKYLLKVR
jgi:DNA-directed RNA polymerase omega subunit